MKAERILGYISIPNITMSKLYKVERFIIFWVFTFFRLVIVVAKGKLSSINYCGLDNIYTIEENISKLSWDIRHVYLIYVSGVGFISPNQKNTLIKNSNKIPLEFIIYGLQGKLKIPIIQRNKYVEIETINTLKDLHAFLNRNTKPSFIPKPSFVFSQNISLRLKRNTYFLKTKQLILRKSDPFKVKKI